MDSVVYLLLPGAVLVLFWSMRNHEARDELFERLKFGKLTPDEAESEARRQGLEPLKEILDVTRFNAVGLAHWTIPMAIAWIAYRTLDDVRNSWQDYRDHCLDWHWRRWRIGLEGEVNEGWFLEQRSAETTAQLLISDVLMRDLHRDPAFSMSASDAKEALWIALQTDCFRASGVDQSSLQRVEIPPLTWYELKCFEQDGVDELRPDALLLSGPDRYRKVLLPSTSLRGLWSPPVERQSLTLPPVISPEGDGYMPLTSAAQWIATKGGTIVFAADDSNTWRPAFEALLNAIGSEKVRVIGTRDGEREPIAIHHFVDCPVEYPFEDTDLESIFSDDVRLRTYCTFDSEREWKEGSSDTLLRRGNALWTRIVVAKQDILQHWQFGAVGQMRNGLPGRPTSRHLIVEEFERRVRGGLLLDGVTQEANHLAEWLRATHPRAPTATSKTIEEQIRAPYRAAKPRK